MIYLLYQNPSSLPNVSLDGLLLWMKKVAALNANLDLMALAHHPDMNAIGCIWVYKAKLKQDGSLERIKAQLVAKRFSQVDGIDFLETFLLVLEVVKGRDIQHSSCTQLESTVSSLSWDISSPSRSCVFFITF